MTTLQTAALLKACRAHVPADIQAQIDAALAFKPRRKKQGAYARCVVHYADGVAIRTGTYALDKMGNPDWSRAVAFANILRRTSPAFGWAVLNRECAAPARGTKGAVPRYEWRRALPGESKYPSRWGCFLVKEPIPSVSAVEPINSAPLAVAAE